MTSWYNKDEKRRETIKQVLTFLEGLTYSEADLILRCALKELPFNSYVCQGVTFHQQCAQKPNSILSRNPQE